MHVDNVVAKVDYRLNDRQHRQRDVFLRKQLRNRRGLSRTAAEMALRYSHARAGGGRQLDMDSQLPLGQRSPRSATTGSISPRLPGDLNTPASAYGLNTGVSGPNTGGLPRIGFGGYFFPGLGGFKWPKFQGPDSITQFVDHVSYTAGKHSLKFGGELHRNDVKNAAYGNARGSITFLGGVASPDPPAAPRSRARWKISLRVRRSSRRSKSGIRPCNCTTGRTGCLFRMTGARPRI